MQPPISLGTMLQKRYRVTKVLGQGGFGRTYLAQDTACFDELCVLKEFSPNDRGKDAMKKSQELFQREAKVLYQIDHPQIPKFRANFEEQKRLFLVQEYAEGKTVSKTLTERLKDNRTFNEEEAILFLNQMLPILAYIHNVGIVHRDISPDNIIFRERDKVPVLIDFGVVKAGVTQLEASTEIHQGTTVGKAGYAPNEQLQTGEAYANSDLYALAVTVVVMMTGRKPESLVDKSTMTWKWHQWVPTLTPQFARILNKMLSRTPTSRFQSAAEVLQAIRANSDYIGPNATIESSQTGSLFAEEGAKTGVKAGSTTTIRNGKTITSIDNTRVDANHTNIFSAILSSPWGIASMAALLLLGVVGVPTFIMMKSMEQPNNPVKTPLTPTQAPPSVPIPTPPPANTAVPQPPAPVPAPVPAPAPPPIIEGLTLEPGKPTTKEGVLSIGQSAIQTVNLQTGQQLKVTLLSSMPSGATMNILAPNQAHVDATAKGTTNWQGNLPLTGEYRIEVIAPATATSTTTYKVEVTATAAAAPSPAPAVSPSPSPAP
jgi:serine/threonine protein kinase